MPQSNYRVLVTGWRNWPRSMSYMVVGALNLIEASFFLSGQKITLIQGECPYGGVDLYAKEWALDSPRNRELESYPAEYDTQGRILGPARNTKMVATGADICLCMPGPGSKGTWDCMQKAYNAKIPLQFIPFPLVIPLPIVLDAAPTLFD